MTSEANENLRMPPNSLATSNLTNQPNSSNNCGLNQQTESTFAHLHQNSATNSQTNLSQFQYQPTIALPTALNASSTFYTPHFTMQSINQFSPITSSTAPVVASNASSVASSIGSIHPQASSLYGKVHQSISNNGSFSNGDDNSSTFAFMEPQQQSVGLIAGSSEDTTANSSGSGSLTGSNSSADNSGGTSSSGSISSLTSASQYDLYHANSSAYSKYKQNEIKPENNANYNEKYLHAFSESDIALATKPGSQMYFDPSICHFSDEDLRPQPMNKKSRKQNVPDFLKDEKYWARRAKNNVAAKKSREQRRLKENQVLLRASYLEKQNQALRVELQLLRCEHAKLANYLPQ